MTHTFFEPRSSRCGLTAPYTRLLSEQSASGLSMSEFAGGRGISAATLYQWRRRLASSSVDNRVEGPDSSALLAVDVLGDSPTSACPSPYEIALSNGISLRIAHDFVPARVAELLTLVRAC